MSYLEGLAQHATDSSDLFSPTEALPAPALKVGELVELIVEKIIKCEVQDITLPLPDQIDRIITKEFSKVLPPDLNPQVLVSDILGVLEERGLLFFQADAFPQADYQQPTDLALREDIKGELFSMRKVLSEYVGFEIAIDSPAIPEFFKHSPEEFLAGIESLRGDEVLEDEMCRELPRLSEELFGLVSELKYGILDQSKRKALVEHYAEDKNFSAIVASFALSSVISLREFSVEIRMRRSLASDQPVQYDSIEELIVNPPSKEKWDILMLDRDLRQGLIYKFMDDLVPNAVNSLCRKYGYKFKDDVEADVLVALDTMLLDFDPLRASLRTFVSRFLESRAIDNGRALGVLHRNEVQYRKLCERERDKLQNELGEKVNIEDARIAENLGVDLKLHQGRLERIRVRARSFSDLTPARASNPNSENALDHADGSQASYSLNTNSSDPFEIVASEDHFEFLISKLDQRKRFIFDMYYRQGATLKEIGQMLEGREGGSLTESRVCQIVNEGLDKARERLEQNEFYACYGPDAKLLSKREGGFEAFVRDLRLHPELPASSERLCPYVNEEFFEKFLKSHSIWFFKQRLYRDEGGVDFNVLDEEARDCFKQFVGKKFSSIEKVTQDAPLALMLGVPNAQFELSRRLVRLNALSGVLQDESIELEGRKPRRTFLPQVVGYAQAWRNLKWYLEVHGLDDLDQFEGEPNLALVAAVNNLAQCQAKKDSEFVPVDINKGADDLARSLLSLNLVSPYLSSTRQYLSIDSRYLREHVVGRVAVDFNLTHPLARDMITQRVPDLDCVTEDSALARLLAVRKSPIDIAAELARREILSSKLPVDHPLVVGGRLSYYFNPQIVGLQNARDNLTTYLERIGVTNLDKLPQDPFLITAANRIRQYDERQRNMQPSTEIKRSLDELAQLLVEQNVLPGTIPSDHQIRASQVMSRYFKPEIVKQSYQGNLESPNFKKYVESLVSSLDELPRDRILASSLGVALSVEACAAKLVKLNILSADRKHGEEISRPAGLRLCMRVDIAGEVKVLANLRGYLEEHGVMYSSDLTDKNAAITRILNDLRKSRAQEKGETKWEQVENRVGTLRAALVQEGLLQEA